MAIDLFRARALRTHQAVFVSPGQRSELCSGCFVRWGHVPKISLRLFSNEYLSNDITIFSRDRYHISLEMGVVFCFVQDGPFCLVDYTGARSFPQVFTEGTC